MTDQAATLDDLVPQEKTIRVGGRDFTLRSPTLGGRIKFARLVKESLSGVEDGDDLVTAIFKVGEVALPKLLRHTIKDSDPSVEAPTEAEIEQARDVDVMKTIEIIAQLYEVENTIDFFIRTMPRLAEIKKRLNP